MQKLDRQRLWGETLLGIRVHDNVRGIWYSVYPEGEQAECQVGNSNLTINVGISNPEPAEAIIWARLSPIGPGPALFDYEAPTPAGLFHNFEVTTNMPDGTLALYLDWTVMCEATGFYDEGYQRQLIILKVDNPNPPPNGNGDGEYLTQQECEAAGYYWYDNACHLTPKSEGNGGIPWLYVGIGVAAVALFGVATYFAFRGH